VADPNSELPLSGTDRALRVRDMFARIVPRYDLMNRMMSAGQDGAWRRKAAAAAQPRDVLALDLATGTGDLALELRRQGARRVIAVDYCTPMLEAAALKLTARSERGITLLTGDALGLPFNDDSFDCVTSGFLLRNVVDLDRCLREMHRVLRPGGRVVALEITHPPPRSFGRLAKRYFHSVVPIVGRIVSGDASAYRYLPASLDVFPDADVLAGRFRAAGFAEVSYRRLSFGAIAIHIGRVPG
jgi:demethylmenaquinone methyltransferase/2-methoxy-6-polyprenyl-1,4-benzoquinol methylase